MFEISSERETSPRCRPIKADACVGHMAPIRYRHLPPSDFPAVDSRTRADKVSIFCHIGKHRTGTRLPHLPPNTQTIGMAYSSHIPTRTYLHMSCHSLSLTLSTIPVCKPTHQPSVLTVPSRHNSNK